MSDCREDGFKVTGCWRQQFDWVVIEWNRDNVYEHPSLRNLPDGDLSGLRLTYEESRSNCIPCDSTIYPTVDWPYLRIWAESNGNETLYKVPLRNYSTAIAGDYSPASVEFELQGTPTAGDYIELAWLGEHYNYQLSSSDTLVSAIAALATIISGASPSVSATADGPRITLLYDSAAGTNGNRIGAYGTVHGAATEVWSPWWGSFSGGGSPTKWLIDLNFSNLRDVAGALVPTSQVRKLRWTWAADLQKRTFERSEFEVEIAHWTLTGTNQQYYVAGPGSRRMEDDDPGITYSGPWTEARGNYSGGSIRWTTTVGAAVSCSYSTSQPHQLFLGTRRAEAGAQVTVRVNGGAPRTIDLRLAGEDVLVRIPLGPQQGQAEHTVAIQHAGSPGSSFFLDFLEIAIPTLDLPTFADTPRTTLATDWDTDHSIAIAPERTAWLIAKLGFRGRANHYAGALWFYELVRPAQRYASAAVQFTGNPEWSRTTEIHLGPTAIGHLHLIGDTAESVAKCFELLINAGSTGVWAQAVGTTLTITSRVMGVEGNLVTLSTSTNSQNCTVQASGPALSGGADGTWLTDLIATPRLNRAARDWSRSYFQALDGHGIGAAAAFSMELQHGDSSENSGIAQRYPDGAAVMLNTPALQTNFGPTSTEFWKHVYLDMAEAMSSAGLTPYLQFGEVQWWYFANSSGMPFYDAYTKNRFLAEYGRQPAVIRDQNAAPEQYREECEFLPGLIGEFTDAIIGFVRQTYPTARFEVLYPPDVNDTELNRVVNLPRSSWTPQALACFKTENFTFTGNRDLDKARQSMQAPKQLGFDASQRSHLIGVGEYTTPWVGEHGIAVCEGVESIVLFALDQFCLIGYKAPLEMEARRSLFMGS